MEEFIMSVDFNAFIATVENLYKKNLSNPIKYEKHQDKYDEAFPVVRQALVHLLTTHAISKEHQQVQAFYRQCKEYNEVLTELRTKSKAHTGDLSTLTERLKEIQRVAFEVFGAKGDKTSGCMCSVVREPSLLQLAVDKARLEGSVQTRVVTEEGCDEIVVTITPPKESLHL